MASTSLREEVRYEESLTLFHFLLENTVQRKLKRGAIKEAPEMFGISVRTVPRIRPTYKTIDRYLAAIEEL